MDIELLDILIWGIALTILYFGVIRFLRQGHASEDRERKILLYCMVIYLFFVIEQEEEPIEMKK